MRNVLILAGMLFAAGCAGQSGGPVQLAASQEGNRCTATVEGRPMVFNTDGRDFSQLRGRLVTIAASANLPSRCVGILIAALQRAGTGPITYDGGVAPQEVVASEEAGRPMIRRASASHWGERPSYEKRARSRQWRGSTMSNSRSEKSEPRKHSTKARSAGR